MAQPDGLLAKSGLDSIKLGGHKVPIALIAGGIALVGVIAVLRARQRGQQVAVGQAPASAADTGFGLPPPGADVGPALANLSQQLTSLGTSINGSASSASSVNATIRGGIVAWIPVGARVSASPSTQGSLVTLPGGLQGWLGNTPDALYGPNVIYDTTKAL